MKLAKVILEGFRGYSDATEIHIDDLTVLIGKNDIGKSTWLEALSIFFEEGSIKPDKQDLNINCEKTYSISASFYPPNSLIIDATNPVSLKEEYLLDSDNLLTIKKVYPASGKPKVYLIAMHPDHNTLKDLLKKKINDLKKIAKEELNIDATLIDNQTKAASWRNAIRNHVGVEHLTEQEILISETDTKEIWEPIKNNLPTYGLFQVDRNNHDQDEEVQDPFKIAIKEILKNEDVAEAIDNLKSKVRDAYDEIASNTINELNKINPKIAKEIHPEFGDPKIENAFKPVINTDTGVPLNKRGSGVRRLVLLSFFKADVLRRKKENMSSNIIYAIEEPETSQHPKHQELLIKSLQEMSQTESAQVIFTTHSGQLVKEINCNNLRYISSIDGQPHITYGEAVIKAVTDELGQLPIINPGYLICVEGTTDSTFLKNVGKLKFLKEVFDITESSILPMGGSFIKRWALDHPLKDTPIKECHLYDKDSDCKYLDTANEVNNWDGCSAFLTNMNEIENYIHPNLLNEEFGTQLSYKSSEWGELNIPKICSQATGIDEKRIKITIANKLSIKMTEDLFEEIEAKDEIISWFKAFKMASL